MSLPYLPDICHHGADLIIREFAIERGHLGFAAFDGFFELRIALSLNGARCEIRRLDLLAHIGLGFAVRAMAADALFLENGLSFLSLWRAGQPEKRRYYNKRQNGRKRR